jgi:hypothetical protein
MTEFAEMARQYDYIFLFFIFCGLIGAGWGYIITGIFNGIRDLWKRLRKKMSERKAVNNAAESEEPGDGQ